MLEGSVWTGDDVGSGPVWTGDEILFWSGNDLGWALQPNTGHWRTFPAGNVANRVDGAFLLTPSLVFPLLVTLTFLSSPPFPPSGRLSWSTTSRDTDPTFTAS